MNFRHRTIQNAYYVNDLDAAETAFRDLRIENRRLGRRFKVISLRWLKPHEA
jgi:hypothetical protein